MVHIEPNALTGSGAPYKLAAQTQIFIQDVFFIVVFVFSTSNTLSNGPNTIRCHRSSVLMGHLHIAKTANLQNLICIFG